MNSASYAIRFRFVAYYLGQLCMSLALFAIVPIAYVVLDERHWNQILPFLSMTLSLGLAGLALNRVRPQGDLQRNEALVIVVLAFLMASLAFALAMYGRGLSFVDSFFEAVSGITTTGLSTFENIQGEPRDIIFTVSWLQWMGGLGTMVLAFALLFGQGLSSKRLTEAMGGQTHTLGGSRAYARIVLTVYLALTVAGVILIKLAGTDWFDAVNLGFAAVSTGGYSPYNDSLGSLGQPVQLAVTGVALSGALAIPLYYSLWQRDWRRVLSDPELHTLWIMVLVLSILLGVILSLHHDGSPVAHFETAFLTVASAQSTAGFAAIPLGDLDADAKLLLIFSMLVGGGAGSTAGGFKLLRLLIILRLIQLLVQRSSLSENAVASRSILGRKWEDETLLTVLLVVLLHLLTVAASWLVFLAYGYDPLNALFDVVSAVSTVGLSTGLVSASLPEPLKWLLCADMLLGRLEFLAILVFLAPRTWLGQRKSAPSAAH